MRSRIVLAALAVPLVLGACGAARELKPRPGETLPVAPYGARKTPTRDQLIKPTTQQRPARTDELLISSQARRSDQFDLPPSRTPLAPLPAQPAITSTPAQPAITSTPAQPAITPTSAPSAATPAPTPTATPVP